MRISALLRGGVVLALGLWTAWSVLGFAVTFEFAVMRVALPEPSTVGRVVGNLVDLIPTYVAAMAVWRRKPWAPRAILAAGAVYIVSQTLLDFVLVPPSGQPSALGHWLVSVDWTYATIVVAISSALSLCARNDSTPVAEPARHERSVPFEPWRRKALIVTAVPPMLYAGVISLFAGTDYLLTYENGNASLAALMALPLLLLMLQWAADSLFGLGAGNPACAGPGAVSSPGRQALEVSADG